MSTFTFFPKEVLCERRRKVKSIEQYHSYVCSLYEGNRLSPKASVVFVCTMYLTCLS